MTPPLSELAGMVGKGCHTVVLVEFDDDREGPLRRATRGRAAGEREDEDGGPRPGRVSGCLGGHFVVDPCLLPLAVLRDDVGRAECLGHVRLGHARPDFLLHHAHGQLLFPRPLRKSACVTVAAALTSTPAIFRGTLLQHDVHLCVVPAPEVEEIDGGFGPADLPPDSLKDEGLQQLSEGFAIPGKPPGIESERVLLPNPYHRDGAWAS